MTGTEREAVAADASERFGQYSPELYRLRETVGKLEREEVDAEAQAQD